MDSSCTDRSLVYANDSWATRHASSCSYGPCQLPAQKALRKADTVMVTITWASCATQHYYQSSNEVASWVASATCGIYERCACFYTWFTRWHPCIHRIQRDSYSCQSLAASAAHNFDVNGRCDCAAMKHLQTEQLQFVPSHSAEIVHFKLADLNIIYPESYVYRAMYIDGKAKPSVTVTRFSQEAKSRKRRDEIRLDILLTLRRALPRDITDIILKSSIHRIRVAAYPDKLIATDPVCSKSQRPYQNRSQRPPRAIAPCKHRGR